MNNNNFDESSRLVAQQHQLTHPCDERAQCCCCCSALMTSHIDEERAREVSKSAPAKSFERANQCSDVQSGFESGIERSHCCAASKLTTASSTTTQQCQSLPPQSCSINNNFSFCSDEGKIISQPCQDSARGRNTRTCPTGNCKCSESGDQTQCADECCATKNGDVEKVSSHRESNSCSSDMRLVKKCKDDEGGSCLETEEERAFKSVPFEAGPRWSGLTGVPGLGASIHQVSSVIMFLNKLGTLEHRCRMFC